MQIEQYIKELLYEFDCVILPGFGAFIGNYSSAKITHQQHLFEPPSKRIVFNKDIIHNDGALSNIISQNEKISFLEASNLIKDYIKTIKLSLLEKQVFELEDIGVFKTIDKKSIQFVQNRSTNFLKSAYGLHSFQCTPIVREKEKPVVLLNKRKRVYKMILPVSIAASLLIAVFLNFYSGNSLFSIKSMMQSSSVSEKTTNNTASFIPSSAATDSIENFAITELFRFSLPDSNSIHPTKTNPAPITKTDSAEIEKTTSVDSVYYIIGGCFGNKTNAKKLVKKLEEKGFASKIMNELRNGLYVVSITEFQEQQKAKDFLITFQKERMPEAWLLASIKQ